MGFRAGGSWWGLWGGHAKKWLLRGAAQKRKSKKRGSRAKCWDKKSGKIAGVTHFGGALRE